MRVLVALDKFKDALSATAACTAVAEVFHERHPEWEIDVCPLSDGGEGFGEILTHAARGHWEPVQVHGPLGLPVQAGVGLVPTEHLSPLVCDQLALPATGSLAVLEMASASGLMLVPPAHRNPWLASSAGTGELLQHAARLGAGTILLGVGGSATNDLGLGALAALGFSFFRSSGERVFNPVPREWELITRIEAPVLRLPPIFIACDVTSPLLGPTGATFTFGPQKGLAPAEGPRLEAQAARLAVLLSEACGRPLALSELPGAGASGGIAFGLMTACGAHLVPGFDLVSGWLDLPDRLAAADLVLTGEGRFDATSLAGKGPGRVIAEAEQLGKRVEVFAGRIDLPASGHLHAITPPGVPLADALPRTAEWLAAAVARVF